MVGVPEALLIAATILVLFGPKLVTGIGKTFRETSEAFREGRDGTEPAPRAVRHVVESMHGRSSWEGRPSEDQPRRRHGWHRLRLAAVALALVTVVAYALILSQA